jgi:hypothetical protein
LGRQSRIVAYLLASSALILLSSAFASPTVYFTTENVNMVIGSNTTLTSNLTAGNLTIANGLTIVTNGYEIYVANTLIAQNDLFITGQGPFGGYGCNACAGEAGRSANDSFGGSGGAGGAWATAEAGGDGGSTLALGGENRLGPGRTQGTVPADPKINNSNITSWYYSRMQNYLEGAGGGGGGQGSTAEGHGGAGANGIYIQAQNLYLTNTMIYANGTNGAIGYINAGGGGGGGGCGRIVVSYQGRYLPAIYNAVGGSGGQGRGEEGYWGSPGGGSCNAIIYKYVTEPIIVLGPATPTNQTGSGGPPQQGTCYSVNSLYTGHQISIYFFGSWFDIFSKSITSNGISAEINGINYSLEQDQMQTLPNSSNSSYTVELENKPALTGTSDLKICSLPAQSSTTTISTSSTSTSTSATTTIPQPSDPPSAGEVGGAFGILLIIALIGIFADNERRKRNQ